MVLFKGKTKSATFQNFQIFWSNPIHSRFSIPSSFPLLCHLPRTTNQWELSKSEAEISSTSQLNSFIHLRTFPFRPKTSVRLFPAPPLPMPSICSHIHGDTLIAELSFWTHFPLSLSGFTDFQTLILVISELNM